MTSSSRRRRLAAGVLLVGLAAGCGGGGHSLGVPTTFGGIDVTVDRQTLLDSLAIEDRFFGAGDCSLVEGSVGGEGQRRLLTFATEVVNYGDEDMILGDPSSPLAPLLPSDFEWSPCHGHTHFLGWADYRLTDGTGSVVAQGHKQAFCLEDSLPVHRWQDSHGYSCSYQGLTVGWADIYDASLDGQWIDVTGVPEGDYVLVVTVNAEGKIPEVDVQPDTVTVPVRLPDPLKPPP